MQPMIRVFAILLAAVLLLPAAYAQTLTGAQAQKSPQADAFLAYEKALIAGGLDGARPYMTAAKVDDLQGMAKAFGDDGFKQFLDRMRSGAQGEARRKQIEKVEVKGDQAVLEARDGPHTLTVQYLAKTGDGWKVSVRP
ncbi:MAG: hypothetical protein H6942_03710 [Candidatus Accumulibacter sp.]|uniref:hypothetical protein n=1 Tax=Accumulibacter sp. TaxID=2053492 RepID=UPI0019F04E66|nr:hypothetical protein [Accumulibacter sp.]MBE2260463.1 hypothetical protein [Paracoccaceae bacterium]MCB1943566.1 hypothetical protein [Accumulibacter sp.]MCP5247644.1 hypothetical protein [Accumulibacter sp.]